MWLVIGLALGQRRRTTGLPPPPVVPLFSGAAFTWDNSRVWDNSETWVN